MPKLPNRQVPAPIKNDAPSGNPYGYQEDGIAYLESVGRGILADEPGLGKSRQAILAAKGKTLVVAPAAVLSAGVWDDEVAKWNPELDVTFTSYHGLCDRKKQPNGHWKMLPALATELRESHAAEPFETVVFDEAHYLKEKSTLWTRAVKSFLTSLDKNAVLPERVYELSGTPMPNWAYEIFVPLTHVRLEDNRKGGYLASYWRWIETYFRTAPSQFGGPFSKDIGNLIGCTPNCKLVKQCKHWEAFHRDVFTYQGKAIFLQRLRDDVLKDLPPLTNQQLLMPMHTEQAKHYADLKKQFIIWLKDQDDQTFSIETWTKSAQFVKLMRCATGIDCAAYPERPTGKGLSNKLDMLTDQVRDQAQPCLVATWFKSTAFLAAERLEAIGKKVLVLTGQTSTSRRAEIVRSFQRGEADALIATIEVIKEGLTLTAADTVHLLERSWRPSSNIQVVRRIHRIGQNRPCTILWYISQGTSEIAQLRTLGEKTDQQIRALTKPQVLALIAGTP